MTTTIYKTPNCPRCRELAAYLTQLGVDFDEQDMSSSEVLTDLRCEGVFVMEAPFSGWATHITILISSGMATSSRPDMWPASSGGGRNEPFRLRCLRYIPRAS